MKRILLLTLAVVVVAIFSLPSAGLYFESGQGSRCTTCHEMQTMYGQWHDSSHRGIACEKCHGGAFTLDASFHLNNIERAIAHVRGELPERIEFGNKYVQEMTERCASCHRQEYAAWNSGPHSASYVRIFADKEYNSKNMLMDDCLRCHGMHFEGGVRDLVAPIDRHGPWRVLPTRLANKPSMPCLTCHQIHRRGAQLTKAGNEGRIAGPAQEKTRPSLAFFDRRSQEYVPVSELPLPLMMDGARPVKMSNDQRQVLCYQCHAPMSTMQVGSGDDRTGKGVHEGISCLACHAQHTEKTRASCATCHPKMSNCGIDVEKMDTTFRSEKSVHNIHWVRCVDCHQAGVPAKKEKTL